MSEQFHILGKGPKHIELSQVGEAANHLREGQAGLKKLSESCCMLERSKTIAISLSLIDSMVVDLQSPRFDHSGLSGAIENVGVLGAHIGKLYATCCTPIRDPLYREIFAKMHLTHMALNSALGISH